MTHVTIYARTKRIGRLLDLPVYASAVAFETYDESIWTSIRFSGTAWVGDAEADFVEILPARLEKVERETSLKNRTARAAWAHREACRWFDAVLDELWRRAHPENGATK